MKGSLQATQGIPFFNAVCSLERLSWYSSSTRGLRTKKTTSTRIPELPSTKSESKFTVK